MKFNESHNNIKEFEQKAISFAVINIEVEMGSSHFLTSIEWCQTSPFH